jgi:hypothetical protein
MYQNMAIIFKKINADTTLFIIFQWLSYAVNGDSTFSASVAAS